MTKDELLQHIEKAQAVAHTICIPIEDVAMEDIVGLVKESKKAKVEVRLWHETSNFHYGVLIELQRFHDRTDCTPFKPKDIEPTEQARAEGESK